MRLHASPASARVVCSVLSYVLFFSLITQLPLPAVVEAAGTAPPTKAGAQTEPPRREGELIVRFREGAGEEAKGRVARDRGLRRRGALRGESRIERLELQPGRNPSEEAALLRALPEVEFAEPNFIISRAQAAANDPRFAARWMYRTYITTSTATPRAAGWLSRRGRPPKGAVVAVAASSTRCRPGSTSAGWCPAWESRWT